jgi:hypothetical protein
MQGTRLFLLNRQYRCGSGSEIPQRSRWHFLRRISGNLRFARQRYQSKRLVDLVAGFFLGHLYMPPECKGGADQGPKHRSATRRAPDCTLYLKKSLLIFLVPLVIRFGRFVAILHMKRDSRRKLRRGSHYRINFIDKLIKLIAKCITIFLGFLGKQY